ncbi:hypothetical protein J5N97_006685 [Dioscorea zingiberensis]|uniref:BHLH domain-containing protein n=1 Tax=Dioscorea zingiberensis TaxID=325984 RepID=A0A9D5DBU0_9LILI|nr:hypothetical protein J5N97_006685 [Dioscorea zingiberensis]
MDYSGPEPSALVSDKRSRLYDNMSRDLDERGAVFLRGGETSQSLSLSDIFDLRDGVVTPKLKAADPPVRATVLYLGTDFSVPISEAVREVFLPYFDKAIWFQNTSLYHFSMFHASHHITPVVATDSEIEAEASAIKVVTEGICPLDIVLDRVVLTSTGVLLGCWQVLSGTDPMTIRKKLKDALPRAPEKQLYDPLILHTSFARLLGPPKVPAEETGNPFNQVQFFHELVGRINSKIHGFKASVSELWFVEEYDVLALALNGRMKMLFWGRGWKYHKMVGRYYSLGMIPEQSPSVVNETNFIAESMVGGSLSNRKNNGKVPKKIHKAEREKLKRDHLNELFLDLGHVLEPSRQNNGKACILGDTTRLLRDLVAQVETLRKENAALMSESRYVTVEKDELKDENSVLEAEIERLQNELRGTSQSDSALPPTTTSIAQPAQPPLVGPVFMVPLHQEIQPCQEVEKSPKPPPLVRRPQARYPAPSDSWPLELLSRHQHSASSSSTTSNSRD